MLYQCKSFVMSYCNKLLAFIFLKFQGIFRFENIIRALSLIFFTDLQIKQ